MTDGDRAQVAARDADFESFCERITMASVLETVAKLLTHPFEDFLALHGADVDARDDRGFTSLHRAAELGHVELVRLLLERGAAPAPEAQGHTPRDMAEMRGRTEVVALLGQYGSG